MSKQKYSMQQVGVLGDSERYMLMPTTAVGGSTTNQAAIEQQYGRDTHSSDQAKWVMPTIRLSPSMGETMSISTMAMTMTCLMSCSVSFA